DAFAVYVTKDGDRKIVNSKKRINELNTLGRLARMQTVYAPPGSRYVEMPHIKNLWPGFPLDSYKAKKKIFVKKLERKNLKL
ncbi:MAG: hypothetical protein ABGY11_00205, partial [Candidatus Thioglobus sp.]